MDAATTSRHNTTNRQVHSHDTRDQIVDYADYSKDRAELPASNLLTWIGLATSKSHHWKWPLRKCQQSQWKLPRGWWLQDLERKAIADLHDRNPFEVYLPLTFMMLDEDVVAVSVPTVYRVLEWAGRLACKSPSSSLKGNGFKQPQEPHFRGHIDISHINFGGTFYYLTTVLDGFSCYIVHVDLRESMTEVDVEIVCQAALEKHPGVKPRIISDNGPQLIANDFSSSASTESRA